MGRMKKVGPTRGFGARYGARVRKKYIRVITEMKKPHKCPRCLTNKVACKRRRLGMQEVRLYLRRRSLYTRNKARRSGQKNGQKGCCSPPGLDSSMQQK